MNEQPIPTFQKAIQATHGCESELLGRVPVRERFQGEIVWKGEVLVFTLLDHPTASLCYAWSVDQQVTAVLHEGHVNSPETAVRAAIVAQTLD